PILNSNFEFPDDLDSAELQSEELKVTVERRCHFKVELSEAHADVTQAWFEDDAGKRKQVNKIEAGGMSAYPWVPLVDGESQILSVAESSTTLVLQAQGKEPTRVPIQLLPTEVTYIRP
ncbi:MAG: hypothetical protein AAGG01_07640, partial [Planctomycetota bacterium]